MQIQLNGAETTGERIRAALLKLSIFLEVPLTHLLNFSVILDVPLTHLTNQGLRP